MSSCPTCTDPAKCVVDRRCTNKMELDKCDWPSTQPDVPDVLAPYWVTDVAGYPAHLYHRNPVMGVIEGFGMSTPSLINLIIIAIIALLVYHYVTDKK